MDVKTESVDIKYEIGDDIGRGKFATVKRCRERQSGCEYAAKFIRKNRGTGRRGAKMENIEKEIQILKETNHRNIINLYEVYDTKREVILILELVDGGELFEYLSEKDKLCEEEASSFVKQILDGVEHLHSQDIAHLDLKPENILLQDKNSTAVKLIDFGLSRKILPKEEHRAIMGTAEFCAPEVISFEPLSVSTDMWSIGVITYVLLSGLSPFLGDNQQETYHNITSINFEFDEEYFNGTSDLAKDFIQKLLVKDTRKRATIYDCLNHPWIKPVEKRDKVLRRSSVINTEHLKKFLARQRWKRSMKIVSLCNRLSRSMQLRRIQSSDTIGSTSEEDTDELTDTERQASDRESAEIQNSDRGSAEMPEIERKSTIIHNDDKETPNADAKESFETVKTVREVTDMHNDDKETPEADDKESFETVKTVRKVTEIHNDGKETPYADDEESFETVNTVREVTEIHNDDRQMAEIDSSDKETPNAVGQPATIHCDGKEFAEIHNIGEESTESPKSKRVSTEIHNEDKDLVEIYKNGRKDVEICNSDRETAEILDDNEKAGEILNTNRKAADTCSSTKESPETHNDDTQLMERLCSSENNNFGPHIQNNGTYTMGSIKASILEVSGIAKTNVSQSAESQHLGTVTLMSSEGNILGMTENEGQFKNAAISEEHVPQFAEANHSQTSERCTSDYAVTTQLATQELANPLMDGTTQLIVKEKSYSDLAENSDEKAAKDILEIDDIEVVDHQNLKQKCLQTSELDNGTDNCKHASRKNVIGEFDDDIGQFVFKRNEMQCDASESTNNIQFDKGLENESHMLGRDVLPGVNPAFYLVCDDESFLLPDKVDDLGINAIAQKIVTGVIENSLGYILNRSVGKANIGAWSALPPFSSPRQSIDENEGVSRVVEGLHTGKNNQDMEIDETKADINVLNEKNVEIKHDTFAKLTSQQHSISSLKEDENTKSNLKQYDPLKLVCFEVDKVLFEGIGGEKSQKDKVDVAGRTKEQAYPENKTEEESKIDGEDDKLFKPLITSKFDFNAKKVSVRWQVLRARKRRPELKVKKKANKFWEMEDCNETGRYEMFEMQVLNNSE